MTNSKPTFVIVPGGWHSAPHYEVLVCHLKAAGHPVLVASLPSLNASDPSVATCHADAKAVRQQLIPLIETESKDVVVIAHSYGGIPGGGSASGLSKSTRTREGKAGGVIGLVYMSAFVVPEGMSLLDFLGGQHAPWLRANQVRLQCRNATLSLILVLFP